MSKLRPAVVALALTVASAAPLAQDNQPKSASPEFDVVSIKKTDDLTRGGGMRTLPDGTFVMTGQPMGTLVNVASPVRVSLRDIVGMPDWMMRELYDVTAKPPAGLARAQLIEQMPAMWRAMFAERMRLVAHIEQRERDVFTLVLARSDGKLGPHLKPSTLDCSPRPAGTPQPPPQFPSVQEAQNRCGLRMGGGTIVSGGITLDRLVLSLGGLAGGEVTNDTGLAGFYALTLTFSPPRNVAAPPDAANPDDPPDIFTALQEQLGLKLVHGKKMMPVFVIDHIERPSEN